MNREKLINTTDLNPFSINYEDTIFVSINDFDLYPFIEDFYIDLDTKTYKLDTIYILNNEHYSKIVDSIIVYKNESNIFSIYKSTLNKKSYLYTFETTNSRELERILNHLSKNSIDLNSFQEKNKIYNITIFTEGYILVITIDTNKNEKMYNYLIYNSFL